MRLPRTFGILLSIKLVAITADFSLHARRRDADTLGHAPKTICQKFALWNSEVPVKTLLPLYRVAVHANEWFDSLPKDVCRSVQACGRQRSVEVGHRLYGRGEPSVGVFYVVEGCIRISGVSREGNETVLDFYGPRTWFGEVETLDESLHTYDAVAVAPSVVLHFEPRVFEELLERYPSFSRGVLRLEALRIRLLLAAIEAYGIQTLEQRLANRLLMLSMSFGVKDKDGTALELHLPQEVLAQLIGTTRQRVNQIMNEWEAAGKIRHHYGRVIIRDRRWLKDLSEM